MIRITIDYRTRIHRKPRASGDDPEGVRLADDQVE